MSIGASQMIIRYRYVTFASSLLALVYGSAAPARSAEADACVAAALSKMTGAFTVAGRTLTGEGGFTQYPLRYSSQVAADKTLNFSTSDFGFASWKYVDGAGSFVNRRRVGGDQPAVTTALRCSISRNGKTVSIREQWTSPDDAPATAPGPAKIWEMRQDLVLTDATIRGRMYARLKDSSENYRPVHSFVATRD